MLRDRRDDLDDRAGTEGGGGPRGQSRRRGEAAPRPAAADPHPRRPALGRRRALRRQADARRAGRGLGRSLPRRPRRDPRRPPHPPAGRRVGGGADDLGRPRGRRRPLGRHLHSDQEGIWAFEVGAFTDHFATWHDEVSRKRAAPGEEDLSSEVAEGALLLREAAPRVDGVDGQRIAAALEVAEDDSKSLEREARRGPRRRACSPRSSATPTAATSPPAARARSRPSASAPASAPGTSSSRAAGAASTASASSCRSSPSSASTSSTCRRSTRSA